MKTRLLLGLLVALMLISATMIGATSAFASQQQQQQLYRINISNKRAKADFTIYKEDDKNNPIKDVEFEVYAKGEVVSYDEQQQQQQTKKYKVLWPNGTESEEFDSKEEAEALADQEKLLFTGKTDAEGKIVLEKWHTVGEIRVVEKEVPEGFEGPAREETVDLSEENVTIVNIKKIPKDEAVMTETAAPTPGDTAAVNPDSEEETTKTKGANTGDKSNVSFWLVLLFGSAIGLAATLKKYYR